MDIVIWILRHEDGETEMERWRWRYGEGDIEM